MEDINLDDIVFDEWNTTNNKTLFNNTINSSKLDVSALCCNEELYGFDKNAGPTWIYPTNYPIRDYQFNIISHALFKNTLVSLPTGLGKTFIAAVLMYNFYRWYPLGKIVFTAPTRPLVAQQIDACYNITAIPQEHTVEMTGSMQVNARKVAWKQKRVFFATPQVVNNDLESGICPGELIRCLVIDEAHRAKGRHAYCQLVEGLTLKGHRLLRILALSATPGSKVDDVITVVKNLHIAHLELRSENCIDVAMYNHSRKIDTIVVPLGDDLINIRKQFVEIMDTYTRRLVQYRILSGNIGGLSKGKVVMLFKEFQNKEKTQRLPQHQRIMQDFTMVITLYHALELLTKHGARVFLNFFDERTDKAWVGRDDNLTCFLERLRDDLGVNPFSINRSTLPDGSVPEIDVDLKFGHPKFDHLKNVIVKHFQQYEEKKLTTKAIVFCEYRESVNLVHCLLLQCRPMIRPHVFIGQGVGSSASKDPSFKAFSQKQQLKVMKMFRENECNVLVSTCIGEEGLDIGSVDLIICFDISNKSPIRLVQRCGRTGREREGHVVILVTEGREHQTLRECILQRDSLNRRVLQSKELTKNLYTESPSMVPQNLKPVCQKMFFTVEKAKTEEKQDKSTKVQSKIKDTFKKSTDDFKGTFGPSLTEEDFLAMYPGGFSTWSRFQESVELWSKPKDVFQTGTITDTSEKKNILSEWLEWQRTLQYTVNVDHSVDSEILTHILKMADSKRFHPPTNTQQCVDSAILPEPTQSETKGPTNKIANKNQTKVKNKIVNNNDIRTMFQKMHKPSQEQIQKAIFDQKANEIFQNCGFQSDDDSKRNRILEEDGITSAMINLMVDINIELPKWDVKKHSQLDPHECFRRKSNVMSSIPNCLSNHFKLPSETIVYSLKDLKHIDISEFERILKLTDNSKDNKMESINYSMAINKEIDFCDDSLLRINDREFVFDSSFPKSPSEKVINRTREDMIKDENFIDPEISKIMTNDDFDIGDVENIFKDTEDEFINNHDVCDKNLSNKIDICDNNLNNKKDILDTNMNNKNDCNLNSKVAEHDHDNNELDLDDDSNATVDYQFNEKVIVENDFDFGEIDDIFDNTDEDVPKDECVVINKDSEINNDATKIEVAKSPPKNPLNFFGLDDVEDLFANDNFEGKIVNENDDSDPPDSPILFSQSVVKNKNLSNNQITSTPFTSNLSKEQMGTINRHSKIFNSTLSKDVSLLSNSFFKNPEANISRNISKEINKTSNVSSFTITQIIDLVNNKEDKNDETNMSSKVAVNSDGNTSEESSKSIILCSQVPKLVKNKQKIKSAQKVSVTILETSESDDSDDDNKERIKSNKLKINDYFESGKRKILSSDECEASPFFKDTPVTAPLIKRNKISLKEKIANTMNNVCMKEFNTSPINLRSQLSQFSKCKPSQWNSNCIQTDSPVLKATISKNLLISSDDDEDFVLKTPKRNRVIKKRGMKKRPCQFIDYEAALSDDSYRDSGDEDECSQRSNTSIIKFICDDEDVENRIDNGIDMEAKYLQSVRSPVKTHGQFKIPMMKAKVSDISIFSQVDHDEHTNYVLDSFCVDDNILSQNHEMSELELAEAILKKRKRRIRKDSARDDSPENVDNAPCTTNPADDSPIGANKKKKIFKFIQSESSTDDELFL